MSERTVSFVEGEYYHLFNRGNSRQDIFIDAADYHRFLALLHLANQTSTVRIDNLRRNKSNPFLIEPTDRLVAIGAYCLMPNHYHLLLKPLTDSGVSAFMKKLGTGYSMYFNKRYKRTGSLFEGKFKAKWADSDEYLRYLFSYIYLNPMKLHDRNWKRRAMNKGDENFLKTYRFSSYYDLASDSARPESVIIDSVPFPDYFSDASDPRLLADWFEQGKTLLSD